MADRKAQVASKTQDLPRKDWLLSRKLIFIALGVIGFLHYVTPLPSAHWLYIVQRLYYFPIVLAGLSWGRRGGVGIAIVAAALFMIGTPAIWTVAPVDVLDQCLEVVVFLLVGLVTGILTDKRKKDDSALREKTQQLNSVYQELRENFEGMKRAERLSALGQLSAGLAHEIRNPLASIEGAATVVQRESHSDERRREFLEIIQKECRRMNGLLSNFLDFARPAQPHLKLVDVDGLLDSVIVLASHAEKNGRVTFQKQLQGDLSIVECDPEQLKQVLLNLTMNAVQATPEEGVILLAAHQNETHLMLDVHDPGPGISSDELERIFDPFFTTKEGGTGLGLSVAHQIVTQHGGTLTVSRNSPEGATFRISLPLRQHI
ncbi:MAG: sensor histidine kinase [Acidobacteriaceae bacterium]|nr:sensor histidine kinase [Acidobacteriaceae bacterium]